MSTNKLFLPFLMGLTILASGCSGGGSYTSSHGEISFSGNTTPAGIDATNAQIIGQAAGESIQIAEASDALPTAVSGTSTDLTPLNKLFIDATKAAITASNLPTGIDISANTCSSGTASFTSTGNTGPVDATMIFSNCTLIGTTITASGRSSMHFDDISDTTGTTGFSFTYTNFTITDTASTLNITLNMTLDCPSGFDSCVVAADFSGTDGTVHRVAEFSFTGNSVDGFNGTATFFHGTYGEVSVTAVSITYGSCGDIPDGGTVSFASTDGSSGTVIFNTNCTVSGTWTDSTGASGSF